MTVIDSHCHLDDRQFSADREQTIARARAAGVEAMLAIGSGDGPPDLESAIRLADTYPFVTATIGVHPHDASKVTPETLQTLRRLAAHPKVAAVGEIGLDYHYDNSPRDVQRSVFAAQLALARQVSLPIVIHTREAWDDTLAILHENWDGPGVLHCFTGPPEQARQALDLGFHLAFGGVITFPKAEPTRQSARLTPLDRLLVETDCPYLAPVPRRGQRNEPAFLLDTVKYLAMIRETTPEAISAATTANFHALFPPRP
jgi:TatD DNase family protein